MNLDTTSKILQIVLGEAMTTSNCDIVTSWADFTSSAYAFGNTNVASNGTTPVTVVDAPIDGFARQVKEVRLFNGDTVAHTVTLQLFDGSSTWVVAPSGESVPAGGSYVYTPDSGVCCTAGGGGSITVTDGTTTVAPVTTMDFTSSVVVTDGGGGTAQLALIGVTLTSDPGISNSFGFSHGDSELFAYYADLGSNENGGNLNISAGGGDGSGDGGSLAFSSGQAGATGNAGGLSFSGGSGGATSGNGGSLGFLGGSATSGDGGDVAFTPGPTGGGGRAGVTIFNNMGIIDPVITNSVWDDDGNLTFSGTVTVGADTAVAGATTLDSRSGIVTSEALVAATTYTLTLTNSFIKTTSVIQITAMNSDGLVTWPVSIACAAGSAVITVGMAALTGTVVINFSVFN